MMDTTDALDLSKENIQPLKQGRKTAQLGTALQAQTNVELQQKLEKEREQYELLIRLYEGDDPLGPRYEYVSWIEQSYPKHGPESNLIPLLEDTLSKFKDNDKYKQDPRFVQLIVKYIDCQSNPLELYQLVYSEGLGTKCALLYKSWADELDKNEDLKRADQIFQLGLKNRAEPFEDLENAHVQFQLSVARRVLCGGVEEPDPAPEDHPRQALSKLKKSVGSTRLSHAPPGTVPAPLSVRNRSNCQTGGIKVFADENCDPLSNMNKVGKDLQKSAAVHKENTLAPGPWNKQGLGTKKSAHGFAVPKPPTTPSFKVHQDPDALKSNRETMSTVPRALKPRKADTFSCPIAVFEPPDPTKKPMYCKDTVYAGTREVQFEEIRAAIHLKRKKEAEEKLKADSKLDSEDNFGSFSCSNKSLGNENSTLKEESCSNGRSSENKESNHMNEENDVCDFSKDKSRSPKLVDSKPEATDNKFWSNKMYAPDLSLNQQSFTINTKVAMNVVANMWNSPGTTDGSNFRQPEESSVRLDNFSSEFKVPAAVKPAKPQFSLYVDEEEEVETKPSKPKEIGFKFSVFSDEQELEPEPKVKHQEVVLNLPYVPSPHNQNPLEEGDGKENNSPVDYTVSTEKRRLSGTLVPATGIPVMEDDQLLDRTNLTCNMTCNTKAFAFELPSSTPLTSNFKPRASQCNPAMNGSYVADFPCQIVERKTVDENNLSMILEASKERYSSSSGSSASSGIRTLSMYSCDSRKSLMTIKEREIKEMLEEEDMRELQENMEAMNVSLPEDIDPFCEELNTKLLIKCVQFPRRRHEMGLCKVNGNIPVIQRSSTVTLDDERYTILGELGKGAYARVVKASCGRRNVALKVQKPACPWEWYICKEIHHRLTNQAMMKAFMNPDFALIYDNASVLVCEWAQFGNLLNVVNQNKIATNKLLPLGVVLHMSVQIVSIIEHLHKCKIIHGDLKPDNLVLRTSLSPTWTEPSIQLIDFGRSIDMTLYPEGTTFTKVIKTETLTCNEMKENKPWTYQTDYYCLAATIYCLLMADYMKVIKVSDKWTLSSSFPRYIRRDIWDPIFQELLNIESCTNLPSLKNIQDNLNSHLQSIDSFLLKQQLSHLMNVLKNV